MAALPRSTTSFRRQGSSGLVWDDRFLSGELKQIQNQEDPHAQDQEQSKKQDNNNNTDGGVIRPVRTVGSINTIDRSRSNGGGRGHRTGRVSPAIEPPSPRITACGCCGGFSKRPNLKSHNRKKPVIKGRSR